MSRPRRQPRGPVRDEAGSTLVLSLVVMFIVFTLGVALLFTSHVDLRASRIYGDWVNGLGDTDLGVNEVIWRLNLVQGAAAPPAGSTISVNSLVNYDASLRWDPLDLLGNDRDDDGDGRIDEADEIHLGRDWAVRVLLVATEPSPGSPWEVNDTLPGSGAPWGSTFTVATIQPQATWRRYSTTQVSDLGNPDVLLARYQRDTDTAVGDSEGDGSEVVYYDPDLASDEVDDRNTLIGLGGDANPSNDSPYNITWTGGGTTYPATGMPVLLLRSTGRVERGGKTITRRVTESLAAAEPIKLFASALCGCSKVKLKGITTIDSYRASQGAYGVGPVTAAGHVGANVEVEVDAPTLIKGDVTSGGKVKFSGGTVQGNVTAGDTIAGAHVVTGTETALVNPDPVPCRCDLYDVVAEVNAAKAGNDNATRIKPNNVNPYLRGTATVLGSSIYPSHLNLRVQGNESIILTGGRYYFDSVSVSGGAAIQVGRDANGDGVVDGPPTEPVRIYVSGGVLLEGDGIVNPLGVPGDLQIYVSSGSGPDVKVKDNTALRGLLYAPFIKVKLATAGALCGAVVGDEVEVTGSGAIHYDRDARRTAIVPGPVRRIAWRELQ